MKGEHRVIGVAAVVKVRNFLMHKADHGSATAGCEKDKSMLFAARAAGQYNARVLANLLT